MAGHVTERADTFAKKFVDHYRKESPKKKEEKPAPTGDLGFATHLDTIKKARQRIRKVKES